MESIDTASIREPSTSGVMISIATEATDLKIRLTRLLVLFSSSK